MPFTIRIKIWFIASLYHVLEISRHFIIVYLTDLLMKRSKGILFILVGMIFSGTDQDWYLACREVSTFLKSLRQFSYSLPFEQAEFNYWSS